MFIPTQQFKNFLESLRKGQKIESYYTKNNYFLVGEVNLKEGKVELEEANTKTKKWYSERDFVGGRKI